MRARLNKLGDQRGYTLLEVLVVVLIIGVLATIALPSFLNQTTKATGAAAEELAHTAQIAAETYATDHDGSYVGLTAAILSQYEPTIQVTSGNGNAYLLSVTNATATGYTVTTTTVNGNATFSVNRSNGLTTRTCTPASGVQGSCVHGTW